MSASIRAPSIGATFLLRTTSSSTARSVLVSISPCTGLLASVSRP